MKTKKFIDFCYHCFKVALLGAPILAVGTSILFYDVYGITQVEGASTETNVYLTSTDYIENQYYYLKPSTLNYANGGGNLYVSNFSVAAKGNVSDAVYNSLTANSDAIYRMYFSYSSGSNSPVIDVYYMDLDNVSHWCTNVTNSNSCIFKFYISSIDNLSYDKYSRIYSIEYNYTYVDDAFNYNKSIARTLYGTGFIKHGDSFDNVISTINSNYVGDYNIDFAYDDLIDDGVLNSLTFTKLNITQVFGLSAANDGYDIYSLLWLDYYLNYLLSMGVLLLAFDVLYWFVRFVRKMLEKPLNRVEGGR